jgi:hypothetical protein
MIAAITGNRVLLVRTQFRHPTAQDCYSFFKKLLDKLALEDPGKGYTFFGDNENIYAELTELFTLEEYRHPQSSILSLS